jgi:hypothetical protein
VLVTAVDYAQASSDFFYCLHIVLLFQYRDVTILQGIDLSSFMLSEASGSLCCVVCG